MAAIFPFRAWRYDPARVALTQVVTQPYDKITPEMQERYYAASPYNLVRIILGKRTPQDNERENVYTRAAAFFQEWRREGIFSLDPQPSVYLYTQRFSLPGSSGEGAEYERRGFIALGRLEDYSSGVVFRHEQTLARPRADRLELLRATRAHFGQIFMLYSDPGREVESLLAPPCAPHTQVRDEYGVIHQLWKISDPQLIARLREKMADKKLIIADGHHRYETALAYRDERHQATAGKPAADTPFERVMMTFVNMDAEGLVILPGHRVLQGLASFDPEKLLEGARPYFEVKELDNNLDGSRAAALLRQAGPGGTALLAVTRSRSFLLQARPASTRQLLAGLSSRQQELDVVQLHKVLLEHVLGISEEQVRNQQHISYLRDAEEAVARVRRGGADVAFLMNPVRLQQMHDLAFAGEVLPQKSTDFYPKLLSGLAVYALE